MRRVLLAAAILGLAGSVTVIAQKPVPKPAAKLTTTTTNYATAPFDVSGESLPRGYSGMDPMRVIAALKTLNITPKGEFETTSDYETKLDPGVLLIGHLTLPYYAEQHIRRFPEFDKPLDLDQVVDAIGFQVSEVIYYMPTPGTIVHRKAVDASAKCS